jgi:hypothetical protein
MSLMMSQCNNTLVAFTLFLKSLTRVFEEFQRTFVKLYRKLEGKQNLVLSPRDPRQVEEEAIPYLAAIWKLAAHLVAQMNGRNVASADLVHMRMLHEAAKKPITNAILCNLHLFEKQIRVLGLVYCCVASHATIVCQNECLEVHCDLF